MRDDAGHGAGQQHEKSRCPLRHDTGQDRGGVAVMTQPADPRQIPANVGGEKVIGEGADPIDFDKLAQRRVQALGPQQHPPAQGRHPQGQKK